MAPTAVDGGGVLALGGGEPFAFGEGGVQFRAGAG